MKIQLIEDWKTIKSRINLEKNNIVHIQKNPNINILINMLISAEDHRFRYHIGFDSIAILRAFRNKIFYNKKEGASTIEQQLTRVITNNFKKSIKRKIKEIVLAIILRIYLDKKIIALIYLNIAYYGTFLESLEKILTKYNLSKNDYIDQKICAEIVARLKYPEPIDNKDKRLILINRRKSHIIKLYNKHSKHKIFKLHVN